MLYSNRKQNASMLPRSSFSSVVERRKYAVDWRVLYGRDDGGIYPKNYHIEKTAATPGNSLAPDILIK